MSVALTTRGRICPGSPADALVTNGRICVALGLTDLTRVDADTIDEVGSVIAALQDIAGVDGGLLELKQIVVEGSVEYFDSVVATIQTIDTVQFHLEEMTTGARVEEIDDVDASVEEIGTVQGNVTEIEDAEATIEASVAVIAPTANLDVIGEVTATLEEFDE